MKYTIVITEDPEEPGAFNAIVPALQGCHTCGNSEDEALERAKEAIRCWLDGAALTGDPIPVEVKTTEVEVTP